MEEAYGRSFSSETCDPGQFFYADGSCKETCDSPLVSAPFTTFYKGCFVCALDQYYYAEIETCLPLCSPPYTTVERAYYTECHLDISPEDTKVAENLANTNNNLINANGIMTAMMSAVSLSDPGTLSTGMLVKMFQYTRFINVTHTASLELMFKRSKLMTGFLFFAPKITSSMRNKFIKRELPPRFMIYGVPSSFIVGFWDGLMSLAILLGLLVFQVIINWIVIGNTQARSTAGKILIRLRQGTQNFLLVQFYSCYEDFSSSVYWICPLRSSKK